MNEPVVRRKPWLLILSGVLAVVIGTIYHFRPLALAGFYIWPLTIWVLIGVAVSLAAVRLPRKRRAGLVGGNIIPVGARAKTVEHSDHRMVIATAYRPT